MMLNTQKLSSLAFGIKDGYDLKNGKKLSDNLQSKVIRLCIVKNGDIEHLLHNTCLFGCVYNCICT